jgi:hypothetical protein
VGLWMRGTVVKRHRRRSASQKMLQQRSEGQECVSYHCGAVRMCACHGLEQGGMHREALPHGVDNRGSWHRPWRRTPC